MTIWFASDHHFSHENILTFYGNDGKLIRPFPSIEAHDHTIVENHNRVVKEGDHVYFMGDVAMKLTPNVKALLGMMRGKKRLLRGNHDIAKTRAYTKLFEEIHATRCLGGVIFSHIPIHPLSLGRWLGNAHGHIHANPEYDSRYLNLSMEAIAYTPVSLETVVDTLRKRKELRDAAHINITS